MIWTLLPFPLYFYEDVEGRGRENRLQKGVIALIMAVFFNLSPMMMESRNSQMRLDLIQAKVHNFFLVQLNLTGLGVLNLQEGEFHKDICNDSWDTYNEVSTHLRPSVWQCIYNFGEVGGFTMGINRILKTTRYRRR